MSRIVKLEESVVNKIAAGEIIVQPANALKEMLENSIDANSSMIDILVKDGGLKLLQITDNGDGINKEDLGLLCERFATSKLSKFEDLESIATYGFRGEALASISHIARLSVITKAKNSGTPLAYKAYYLNGKLAGPNFKGQNVDPKPIAGKDGTQIIVEDLFYNVPSRLKSIRSKNDEYLKILDVVGKYAVHTGGVGLSLKKHGESQFGLITRPNLPLKERIRTVYGSECAKELLDIDIDGHEHHDSLGLVNVKGVITNCNFNYRKRMQSIFFINHRLVSCEPLKRAINSVYSFFLPKGYSSFVYLSLELNPQILDVNVHPTKREVRFLNEEEIIEIITTEIHSNLSKVDASRTFKSQALTGFKRDREDSQSSEGSQKKYRQENKLVRIDASQPKLSELLSNGRRPRRGYTDLREVLSGESQGPEVEEVEMEETEMNEVENVESTKITQEEVPEEQEESVEENYESEENEPEEHEPEEHESEEHEPEEQAQEAYEYNPEEYEPEETKEHDTVDDIQEGVIHTDEVLEEEPAIWVSPETMYNEQEEDNTKEAVTQTETSSPQLFVEEDSDHSQSETGDQTYETTIVDPPSSISKLKQFEQPQISTSSVNDTVEIELEETQLEIEFDDEIRTNNKKRIKVGLDSIADLKKEVEEAYSEDLGAILKSFSFVGVADETKRLCCIQHDVNLYLCDYGAILYEFYYQAALEEFCNYGEFELTKPLKLQDILAPLYEQRQGLKDQNEIIETIVKMKEMFEEYFSIKIVQQDNSYYLVSLPMIIKTLSPSLTKLPYFIYRLGNSIDYENERKCLQGIMQEISLLYVPEKEEENEEIREAISKKLEDEIFPLLKGFKPPKSLSGDINQIANLPGLYKIFERC
ncbi:DNA mismatch repair protein Mlh1p [[Candida] jaroonii]|uniref:DNA mismatch repair protein Mlh1p n=1 Tax=[Candida] jaroonii TaxID=467808 RepID=A0ACA9Y2C3_9ASCO|nr:DNA mismatch repair protein Mlh1p [[Candida] jaroonii]